MDKVGMCIQYDGVNNYGTVLQAYASQRVVQLLGCDARLIKYKKKYTAKFIIQQIPRLLEPANWNSWKRSRKRKKRQADNKEFQEYRKASKESFGEFRKQFFPHSSIDVYDGYEALVEGSANYSSILVGSDQLWLPSGLGSNFYNLMFVKDEINKISCATSFGVAQIPKNKQKKTADFLKRINYLSVREESGKEIIKTLIGRDAYVSCDPVMLMSEDEWCSFIETVDLPGEILPHNYILCYFLGGNDKARTAAKNISEATGLPILTIKNMEDYFEIDDEFGDYAPKGLLPQQFVYAIKNARYVLTDSFHGTAFSIIFKKQFLTFYRTSSTYKYAKTTRIDNILNRFNLQERLYLEGDAVIAINKEVDRIKVDEILNSWRGESITFLKNALEKR